jgi:cystathionine gamma-synthase
MSAIHLVTTVFLKPGDLLVAPHDCYGGSYRLFDSLANAAAIACCLSIKTTNRR